MRQGQIFAIFMSTKVLKVVIFLGIILALLIGVVLTNIQTIAEKAGLTPVGNGDIVNVDSTRIPQSFWADEIKFDITVENPTMESHKYVAKIRETGSDKVHLSNMFDQTIKPGTQKVITLSSEWKIQSAESIPCTVNVTLAVDGTLSDKLVDQTTYTRTDGRC